MPEAWYYEHFLCLSASLDKSVCKMTKCKCKMLPLGGIVRASPPKPVGPRQLSLLKPTALRVKLPLPCMPWRSCKSTKPRHSKTCTRVAPPGVDAGAALGDRLRSPVDEGQGTVPREGDVRTCGPKAPAMAQPGRDEGRRQSSLS